MHNQQMFYSRRRPVFAGIACSHRFVFKPNMREWDLKIQPIIIPPSSKHDTLSFTPRIKDQLHIGYNLSKQSRWWCCNLLLINPSPFPYQRWRETIPLNNHFFFSIHIELLTFQKPQDCRIVGSRWKVSKSYSPAHSMWLNKARSDRYPNTTQTRYHQVIALMKNNYIYCNNLSTRCNSGYFKREKKSKVVKGDKDWLFYSAFCSTRFRQHPLP